MTMLQPGEAEDGCNQASDCRHAIAVQSYIDMYEPSRSHHSGDLQLQLGADVAGSRNCSKMAGC